MRKLRTGPPHPEIWHAEDIKTHLSCDKATAEKIMKDYRSRNGIKGYGSIEKHLMLDFIEEKQREYREREARYNADIATAENIAILKKQVQTLEKMWESSSSDARKAHIQSLIANFISGISIAIAILALVLKLN